jgi:DNA polymerase-3 subunit epsilon/exodeoxyribonuclease X
MTATSWKDAPLVALDLEGTGGQDRENEDILEITLVPVSGGQPAIEDAFTVLINPGRPIPRSPWISPGLTSAALAGAPALADIAPELIVRLTGKVIVGHNISVDWRLLSRRCPGIHPESLIDTLRLARHLHPGKKGNGLAALLDRYELTETVNGLAPGSQPHRALWDAIGSALLLVTLIGALPDGDVLTLAQLSHIAGLPFDGKLNTAARTPSDQISMLDI